MKKKIYYFDYAAATPLDPRVKKAMVPYEGEYFGNPSSAHQFGEIAKNAVEKSRQKIAKILNCQDKEIIFTGSGTEANNLAILGIARIIKKKLEAIAYKPKVKSWHIITSKIEHESVLEPCRQLEKEGFEITYLQVDKYGFINPKDVQKALTPETILVSIMYANNEIGTIEPVTEISKIIRNFCHESGIKNKELKGKNKFIIHNSKSVIPYFHTDATQAAGFLNLNVQKLGVDLMTLNAAKIYGPKGTGILYKKDGINLQPLIYGGGQEKNLRSGTENVPAIIGAAKALEITQKYKNQLSEIVSPKVEKMTKLRDYLIKELLKIPNTVLNGPQGEKRLPNNINISFLGNDSETILAYLEKYNIYASAGSACSSDLPASYVISEIARSASSGQTLQLRSGRALQLRSWQAQSAVRFSLGKETTKKDIDFLVKQLKKFIKK